MKNITKAAIKPFSALLFLENNIYISLFLLFLTFLNPNVAIGGLIAIAASIIFSEIISFREDYLASGFFIYNSLLVGMSIGYISKITFLTIILITLASILTFIISYSFNRLFHLYKIPILSLPFSIVSIIIYAAIYKYIGISFQSYQSLDINLPLFISGYLHSMGSIFFSPNNIMGLGIVFILVYKSRILLLMSIVGYYIGVGFHTLYLKDFSSALNDPFAFNYILTAMALCGIFLLPTKKNFLIAIIAILISVIISDSFNSLLGHFNLPILTLPFNIVVMSFIFVLYLIGYREFNYDIRETPEKSFSTYLSKVFRFNLFLPKISLPFEGDWVVYQAFNDKWTHKGKFKYAYDFVKKENNLTYKNEGIYLEDYYAFGAKILAPISGYVIDIKTDLPDNTIGDIDRLNNWGNYIIIKSNLGTIVEISHLKQYSSMLKIGDYVKVGDYIAQCGNSGYSPEPHIHIQVQEFNFLGSSTKPFVFDNYIFKNELYFNRNPKRDIKIRSLLKDRILYSKLLFVLDDQFDFEVIENSKVIGKESFTVKMNPLGEFYFQDLSGNKLFFYYENNYFYFYEYKGKENSYLKYLFILAGKIPYSMLDITYIDYLPTNIIYSKFKNILIEFLSIFNQNIYKQEILYHFENNKISSKNGYIIIEKNKKGFQTIKYKNIELRRIS